MTRLRLAMLAATMCALPAPALAQTQPPAGKSDSGYYVVVDTRTKNCTVVDKPPQVDSPAITIATDTIYRTHAEAEAAVKMLKPCQGS